MQTTCGGATIDLKHFVGKHWPHILEVFMGAAAVSLLVIYRKDLYAFGKSCFSTHQNTSTVPPPSKEWEQVKKSDYSSSFSVPFDQEASEKNPSSLHQQEAGSGSPKRKDLSLTNKKEDLLSSSHNLSQISQHIEGSKNQYTKQTRRSL